MVFLCHFGHNPAKIGNTCKAIEQLEQDSGFYGEPDKVIFGLSTVWTMEGQQQINYKRVAEAIAYLKQHFKSQPSWEEVAENIHLSPHHFQRLFTNWAGTSPKKFLQYISLEYAKRLLKEEQYSLFDAAYDTGLSGTGRLHDLFVTIEGMTPAAYKNGGEALTVHYSWQASPFGEVLLGSTHRGLCYMAFVDDRVLAMQQLINKFPAAQRIEYYDAFQQAAMTIFKGGGDNMEKIKLHLKGTPFQLKVWEALLKIPMGTLSTYSRIAGQVGSPKASRAVGTAIGSNPIAFLIPCHRVIQSNGTLGGYMWGVDRKTVLIGWEAAQKENAEGQTIKQL